MVVFVQLDKSTVRNLYNFVAAKKMADDGTKILVFELSADLKTAQQVYSTDVEYMPVLQSILPLGVAGFTELGNFFIVELNNLGHS